MPAKKTGDAKKRPLASERHLPSRKSLGAFGLFSESLKSSLELRFFIIPLMVIVLGIIAIIGIGIVAVPILVFGVLSLVSPAGIGLGIGLILLAMAIFVVLLIISSAIIGGFYIKSVDQYLKTKEVSIEGNIRYALARWKKLSGVAVLQALLYLGIAAVTFLPALIIAIGTILPNIEEFALAAALGAEEAMLGAMLPIIAVLVIGFAVFAIVSFFISPLTFLWSAAAVFEDKPVMECIRGGYGIGKWKYLRNLGALFLMGILGIAISGFQMFDPTILITVILSIWLELVSTILVVKVYREATA